MPRHMVLYALPGGRLLVYSAVAVDEATLTTILKLGTPAVLCVPNRFHRLDASVWLSRFPTMQVFAPSLASGPASSVLPPGTPVRNILDLPEVCARPPLAPVFSLAQLGSTNLVCVDRVCA